MTISDAITLVIGALVTFVFGTVGGAAVQWAFKGGERKREAARQKAVEEKDAEEAEKRRIERINLLAEAQNRAQQTALESANAAFQTVKAQCDECQHRLTAAEDRMYASEQRERHVMATLRATIRALDSQDPAAIAAAIAAARELV